MSRLTSSLNWIFPNIESSVILNAVFLKISFFDIYSRRTWHRNLSQRRDFITLSTGGQ